MSLSPCRRLLSASTHTPQRCIDRGGCGQPTPRAFAHSWLPQLPAFLVELYGAHRVSARLSGRAKGTTVTVSITVNRHEELSDRSAPYADFGHGSALFAAQGAAGFPETAESTTKFHFMPFKLRMQGGGLHAHFNRRQASPRTAASGSGEPSGSASGHWDRDPRSA